MIKSFHNIFRPPCDIVEKTGLTILREALRTYHAKTDNRKIEDFDCISDYDMLYMLNSSGQAD